MIFGTAYIVIMCIATAILLAFCVLGLIVAIDENK